MFKHSNITFTARRSHGVHPRQTGPNQPDKKHPCKRRKKHTNQNHHHRRRGFPFGNDTTNELTINIGTNAAVTRARPTASRGIFINFFDQHLSSGSRPLPPLLFLAAVATVTLPPTSRSQFGVVINGGAELVPPAGAPTYEICERAHSFVISEAFDARARALAVFV